MTHAEWLDRMRRAVLYDYSAEFRRVDHQSVPVVRRFDVVYTDEQGIPDGGASARRIRLGVLTDEAFYPSRVCSGRERLGE